MTVNIETWWINEYTTNIAHLLQRKGGKYRSAVMENTGYRSEGATVVDQIGAVEMDEVVGRFEAMPRTDAPTDRVWIYPGDHDLSQMCDTFDLLKGALTDVQSAQTQAAVMAARRKTDNIISDAFFADQKTGKNGGTTVAFDTTNHRVDAAVGASADTGMNVEKVLRGIRILEEAEVDLDEEELFIGLTPRQCEDLSRQQQVINSDYQRGLGIVLDDRGNLIRFAGATVVKTTRVPSNSSYRLNPLWVKSGMHLGVWADMSTRVDPRPDIRGVPYQIYCMLSMGATRTEPGRVIQIENTEA